MTRNIAGTQTIATATTVHHGRIELDSHADTTVFGKNFVLLSYTGRECDVAPYTDTYDAIKNIPIVSAATAWTSLESTETYILVFNEGLWMQGEMDHSLINPNQMRHNGATVQDNPFSPSPLFIETAEADFVLPLEISGTNILANTRTPTDGELANCRHVVLTSALPWNPHNVRFPKPVRSVEEEIAHRHAVVSATSIKYATYDVEDEVREIQRRLIDSVKVTDIKSSTTISAVVLNDVPTPRTFVSKERHTTITAAELSERWLIGLSQATDTLKKTTQRIVRSAVLPLGRRYKADRIYELPRLPGEWFTDTVHGRTTSRDGNKYGQVFANHTYFAAIYPMDRKGKAGEALRVFCQEFGVPERLTMDGAKEQIGSNSEFMHQIRKNGIDFHVIEPERHNQNPAEGVIREIRRKWFRVMFRKKVPKKFWDYGMRWVCEIQQRTHLRSNRIDGGIPLEKLTGETQDISEYLDFGFYDRVWYHENAGLGERRTGRWLGVSHRTGSLMSYWVLTQNGYVISRTTVQRVTNLESELLENQETFSEFDEQIKGIIRDDNFPLEGNKPDPADWADMLEDDEDFQEEFNRVYQDKDIPEADDTFTPDLMDDTYRNMEVALPRDSEGPEFARVTKRLRDANGLPIGTANDNPILDTRMYEVEYADGHKASMAANAIAQNMFAQVDEDGNRHVLFDEITDHRSDESAVKQADAFITNASGTKRRRETTKGWEFLVRWEDSAKAWVPLKDMKESYPVQTCEYSILTRIHEEPAFAWWAPYVIKKRNRIIAKVKSKYWVKTHKFGIKVPKSVEQAVQFDKENGNTLWWDAICQEMKNVRIAFEVFEGEVKDIPIGYQKVDCHMIFDIKMGESFRRKARMVAGGHTTEVPATLTYSSVVSRDSVRIALTIAALNGLKVLACDIQNAFLTAKCREKCYTRAGPEFGSDHGKLMLITRALYGLRASGATFRSFLGEALYDLGYVPTKADPDVWIRLAVKPCGFRYYEMLLCYVDDVLSISDEPLRTMRGIQRTFKLKDDKIAEPEDYLGASLAKMTMSDGSECWSMSSEKYVKAAVANVEEKLAKSEKRLPSRCNTPLKSGYRPEMDDSCELKADGLQYYQELVGVLRWMVELGRVDILLETSLMSAHLALPRLGHLEQLIHMFGYLKAHPKRHSVQCIRILTKEDLKG